MENHKAKICVPVCVGGAVDLAEAVERAVGVGGDFVEIRFDYFAKDELADAITAFAEVRHTVECPFVVTFRPQDEGGHRAITTEERLAFWSRCADLWNSEKPAISDFADVEFQLLTHVGWKNQIHPHRVICSYHEFDGASKGLGELCARMAKLPGRIVKIAVNADDATDCIPLFNLLERAQRDNRELIAIGMGQAGVITRILGPSRGSYLTYGSLDEDSATAEGQLAARELREIYRIDSIDRETEIMGVIGRPVTHSISPHIHNAAFAQANINAVFLPMEVHDVDAFIRRMVRPSSREIEWNLRGLSVTAPHKTAVIKHLDWIEPAAKEIGAVNTIVVHDDGTLHGYNTDAGGFIEPLKIRMQSLSRTSCAVIGAGGAARAVVWALRNAGAAITVFSRSGDKARKIRDDFGIDGCPLSDANLADFDIVINATPVGTRGPTELDTLASAAHLRGVRLAYDLVYNPLETLFLREARAAGCETIGGLEMLIGQAVQQFKLWSGIGPSEETMRQAAIRAIG